MIRIFYTVGIHFNFTYLWLCKNAKKTTDFHVISSKLFHHPNTVKIKNDLLKITKLSCLNRVYWLLWFNRFVFDQMSFVRCECLQDVFFTLWMSKICLLNVMNVFTLFWSTILAPTYLLNTSFTLLIYMYVWMWNIVFDILFLVCYLYVLCIPWFSLKNILRFALP